MTPDHTSASVGLPGLDVPSVERWLSSHVDDLEPPLQFQRVGRGRSNLTYLVSSASGGHVVIRRPPAGTRVESAHDLAREHGILERLSAAGQAVPRPVAFCSDPEVTGAEFYVMEHIDGVVADSQEAVEAGLAPDARAAVGPALAQALAQLHAVDLEAAGLARPGKGADYAARQIRRWSRQWGLTRTRELPALEAHTARLQERLPAQGAVTLVHGDFTVFNSILSPHGAVRAVLDWELSTIGDPIADLAWLLMWWPDEERTVPPGAIPVVLMPGFDRSGTVLDAYVAASGRDVSHLGWWKSLSYWKLAVIIEGILHRWQQDPANGGHDPGALAPGVEKLVQLAEETLETA